MTPAFLAAVEFVLRHEGGLVDDTADPGGVTNFGISQRSYPDLDVRHLTREQALEIYHADFWERCQCDELPAAAATVLFDAACNQGPGAAIRMLQAALEVATDGAIGPETIAAAHATPACDLVGELCARRAVSYGQNPRLRFERFGLGWMRRLMACYRFALEQA